VIGRGSVGRLENLGGGNWRYTFLTRTPSTASGTWAFGLEGYRSGNLPDGTSYRYGAINPVAYADLLGGMAVPRSTVVDVEKCNACHGELMAHGNNRDGNTQYCILCHNPVGTDVSQRPPSAGPPASIDFKVMLHKLHMGANLPSVAAGQSYGIWGFGGHFVDFSEIVFPGRIDDCSTCHAASTFNGAPSKSVCTSCHDADSALAHAQIMTSPSGVETCEVCHGADAEFSAARVHRR
jgi:OmcA/MtrC family decaheme c-type cytochrome